MVAERNLLRYGDYEAFIARPENESRHFSNALIPDAGCISKVRLPEKPRCEALAAKDIFN